MQLQHANDVEIDLNADGYEQIRFVCLEKVKGGKVVLSANVTELKMKQSRCVVLDVAKVERLELIGGNHEYNG